jgi:peptide/nickel transport system substrate-binding protein
VPFTCAHHTTACRRIVSWRLGGCADGTLTFASTTETGDFNYHTMNISVSAGGFLRNAVYGSLFYQNSSGDIVYDLAESFSTDDGSTWTLELRPHLMFTDGSPLDAEAVKWTWEKIAELPGRGQPIAQTIASLTVVSPTTLVAELVAPNTVFDRDGSATW